MENKSSNKGIIVLLVIIILILVALVALMAAGTIRFGINTPKTNKQQSSINELKEEDHIAKDTAIETDNKKEEIIQTASVYKQKSSVSTSEILSYYKRQIALSNDSAHKYAIVDINDDEIPELLMFVTGNIEHEIIADTTIFTYDENKGDKSNNYIIYAGSIAGRIDTDTILYKMNDGRLLAAFGHMGSETLSYFKFENDWIVRTDFSTREVDDYIKGDKKIEFKPCSDTSLIENYN